MTIASTEEQRALQAAIRDRAKRKWRPLPR